MEAKKSKDYKIYCKVNQVFLMRSNKDTTSNQKDKTNA